MQEMLISPRAVEIRRTTMTPAEAKLMGSMANNSEVTVEGLIPDDVSQSDFNRYLDAAAKGFVRASLATESMMLILGRLFVVADARPDLWQDRFATFEAFADNIQTTYGISRSSVFDLKSLAIRWTPVLSAVEFEAIGRRKLKILGKVVDKGNEGRAATRKLLEFARDHTEPELKKHLESKGLIEASEATGTHYTFPCNKKQAKIFDKWFGDARVQSKVGSGQVAEILEAMVQECTAEWVEQGEAAMQQQSGTAAEA